MLVAADGVSRVMFDAMLTVGRHPRCDLRVEHPRVSGHHAVLEWEGERWTIKDLGSKHGTSLNKRRLHTTRPLKRGDRICFAGVSTWNVEQLVPPAGGHTSVPTETVTGQQQDWELDLYLSFTAADEGTIRITGPLGEHAVTTGQRFVLLFLLGDARAEWVPDEQLRLKLWGRRQVETGDAAALHKLIHDTRALLRSWGLDGSLVEKHAGKTRLRLEPDRVHVQRA